MGDSEFAFKWNHQLSRSQNFVEWYRLNSEERSSYGDPSYSEEMANEIFKSQFPRQFINEES